MKHPKEKLEIRYCTKCGRTNVGHGEHFAQDRSGMCAGKLEVATYRLDRVKPVDEDKPRNIFARDTPRNF